MMTDKAVSTEDLCIDLPRNASLEAARLEAVIKTLIETKVETLKNARKSSSITSSPKGLFNKLRGNSTSTVSSKDDVVIVTTQKSANKRGSRASTTSKRHHLRKPHERTLQFSDEDCSEGCYCRKDPNEIQIHVDDDFISLNIEDYDHLDPDELQAMKTIKRAQRKKRKRRKHRHERTQIKMAAVQVQVNDMKDLDDDELSQRARVTIALTAFLLLFMCLLLVGITLRMAPLIDDMVRKENEEFMNSLAHDSTDQDSLHNLTVSVPLILK